MKCKCCEKLQAKVERLQQRCDEYHKILDGGDLKEIDQGVLAQRLGQFLENNTNTPYPWDTARKLLDYVTPWGQIVERVDTTEVREWEKKMTEDFWEAKK